MHHKLPSRILAWICLTVGIIDLFLYFFGGIQFTFSQKLHTAFFSTILASFYVGHLCGHWLMREPKEHDRTSNWIGFLVIVLGFASFILYFGLDINIMLVVPNSFTLYHPIYPFILGMMFGAFTFPMPE